MRGPRVAIVMGVAGAGKTAVGEEVARRLGWRFLDADDLHTEHARQIMASGIGLTDADRAPWLAYVRDAIVHGLGSADGLVVACSALKAAYRAALVRPREPALFLWIDVPERLLRERLAGRTGHFAREDLLPSQLQAFEPPTAAEEAVRIDGARPFTAVVDAAVAALAPA